VAGGGGQIILSGGQPDFEAYKASTPIFFLGTNAILKNNLNQIPISKTKQWRIVVMWDR
jgi:hypothetical protein